MKPVNWATEPKSLYPAPWSPSRDQRDKLEMLAVKYRCTPDEAFDRAIGIMLELETDLPDGTGEVEMV